MRVALFVSTHGYGHAARSSAVVDALKRRVPELELQIFTQVPRWFFEDSLGPEFGSDFEYVECETDVGLAQRNALDESIELTCERLSRFWPPDDEVVERIAGDLERSGTDLVLADISPLGLTIAERAEIPSVLVENFTWDWIYEHQHGDTTCLDPYRESYRHLYRTAPTLTIQTTPFCQPREDAVAVAPVSRRPRLGRVATRSALDIAPGRPSILLTMGGFSWDYDFRDRLRERDDVDFVIPGSHDAVTFDGNLRLLPHRSDLFHPDLVRATDAIVGKVGYSTLAEAYAARTRFIYLDRPQFPESHVLPQWMAERLPTHEISREEFETAGWLDALDRLLAEPRPEYEELDGADEAAWAILEAVGQREAR